jgi:hypothetical protein
MVTKRAQNAHQKSMLRWIERYARTAAVLRLRGNVQRARHFETRLDYLVAEAKRNKLSGAATKREERGQQAATRFVHKAFGYKRARKDTKLIIRALRARS